MALVFLHAGAFSAQTIECYVPLLNSSKQKCQFAACYSKFLAAEANSLLQFLFIQSTSCIFETHIDRFLNKVFALADVTEKMKIFSP